jgi:tripartite-type tricarboxylate transporter receptor subunit TctC
MQGLPALQAAGATRRSHLIGLLLGALACGLLAAPLSAQAQAYPDRPVRWVVPWPPGGGADLLARMLNVKLSEALGQQVIIDNRGGAAGNIGAAIGAKAPPDGYTITFAYSGTHSINPHIYPKMPFQASDFVPVVFLTLVPQALVVNPSLPVKNVADFIALSKTRQLTYGSSGQGSINHLGGEMFAAMSGANLLHVPYRGGGPATNAVMAGEVDALFGVPVVLAPQIKAGKLRAIGITTAKRAAALPEVPTIAESGVQGFDVSSWNGVLVPAGTPKDVIARLNGAFNKVLADPDVKKQLVEAGYEIVGGEPEKFTAFIDSELAKWGPVVKQAKIQAE